MAKDTEKLIRQLSLISFLMAERRPVSALEIRQDVEGYAQMTSDEAFNRRFYADRAELAALGIELKVEKSERGLLRGRDLHAPARELLPAGDRVLRPRARRAAHRADACSTASSPTPSRCGWRSSSCRGASRRRCRRPSSRSVAAGDDRRAPAAASCRSGCRRSRPRSSAARRSSSTTTRWAATPRRSARSTPTTCSSAAASSTSSATRTSATPSASSASRASAARSATARRPSTTSSAPRTSTRASTPPAPTGSWARPQGTARIWLSDRDRLAGAPPPRPRRRRGHRGVDDGVVFETAYGDARQLISWVLGLGERARILEPPELVEEAEQRVRLGGRAPLRAARPGARRSKRRAARGPAPDDGKRESHDPPRALRPAGHARRHPDRGRARGRQARPRAALRAAADLRDRAAPGHRRAERRELRRRQLRALRRGAGRQIEVDPEPYGDNFARPARLLPLEAKALVAAIDLVGEHLPEGSLASARDKIVDALGRDPAADGLQITTAKGDDSEIARVVCERDRRAHAAARSSTTRRTRTSSPRARSSPTS